MTKLFLLGCFCGLLSLIFLFSKIDFTHREEFEEGQKNSFIELNKSLFEVERYTSSSSAVDFYRQTIFVFNVKKNINSDSLFQNILGAGFKPKPDSLIVNDMKYHSFLLKGNGYYYKSDSNIIRKASNYYDTNKKKLFVVVEDKP